MTTSATIHTSNGARWYYPDGRACYELPKAKGDGVKQPTLADARKLQLLPSVTTILQVLDKPALNDWRVTQGVMAVMTTPRLPQECDPACPQCGHAKLKYLDDFLNRVLQVERVQDQESQTARDRGTEIHSALEAYFLGQDIPDDIRPWIEPAAKAIAAHGQLVCSEKILVGDGYAGRVDLVLQPPDNSWIITDIKSTRILPEKSAYPEAKLQLAAYAKAWEALMIRGGCQSPAIKTQNVYISTTDTGNFIIHESDWKPEFTGGFIPALKLWQHLRGYKPSVNQSETGASS